MKSFCPDCGSLMNYVGAKPKFCSSCGSSLDSLSKTSQASAPNEEVENTEEEIESIPKVDGLEIEIQRYDNRGQTLGNVMETYQNIKPPENNQENTEPPRKVDRQQFLDNWQKEAGALRPNKPSK